MKALKLIIPVAGLLLTSATAYSQTVYDTNNILDTELNGTGRFVGMGGAMGALGGDITTMGTNPAGIGIYRSSDLNLSFGFSNVGNKAIHGNREESNDKFFGSFDNVGFVLSLKQGDYTGLRYVNFGFNYRKLKSFDRNTVMSGDYKASQTDLFAHLASQVDLGGDYFSTEEGIPNHIPWPYTNDQIPWLGAMAFNSHLISEEEDNFYSPYQYGDIVLGDYFSRERGAIHSYDFNIAFNFSDRFYLGATLGIHDVDYRKNSTYSEVFDSGGINDGEYTIGNDYSLDGTGFNFKLGGILRPFESSPLRIGFAVHTPTFYRLTAWQLGWIASDVYYTDKNGIEKEGKFEGVPQDLDGYDFPSETKYELTSPWKYNVSLGYTVGSNFAFGAEYEYTDYSTSRMKNDYYGKMTWENDQVKTNMQGVHALRLGAELKVVPEFALRAGYNYITSGTKTSAFNEMASNSIRTDTEYANRKAMNNFTLGFGYRGSSFYADMAYQFNHYKQDFYAFDTGYAANVNKLSATEITNEKHQLLFTLGMRF